MTQFNPGQRYSRQEISAALGGSPVAYLPVKDNRVVCGCFRLSPRYNPGAPEEVTIGTKPIVQKSAELVAKQTEPIPVFLFRLDGAWEYVGLYRCRGFSTNRELLDQKMRENPARGIIGGILYFEPAAKQVKLPEEVAIGLTYTEGSVQQILVNRYERNSTARDECIRYYGTTCFLCGFDFVSVYGKVMDGFTHVYHLKPLSSIGADYEVDPIQDLRPVCPNCHAVLHRREPAYSLDEVRQFLQARS